MDEQYWCRLLTLNEDLPFLAKQIDKSFLDTKTYGQLFDYMLNPKGDAMNPAYNSMEECMAESVASRSSLKDICVSSKDGSNYAIPLKTMIFETLDDFLFEDKSDKSAQCLKTNTIYLCPHLKIIA